MIRLLKRVFVFLGLMRRRPPGLEGDPYAWRPVPRQPQPNARSGAVAVAEPEE